MTPVENGMGYSDHTILKEGSFTEIIKQHLATVREIWRNRYARHWPKRYYYIDLTAGCGRYDAIDCDGSPVIVERLLRYSGVSYEAHFIDIEEANTLELRERFGENGSITVHTGDHNVVTPDIVRQWPQENAYGLVYADPNGIPPFDLFVKLSQMPRLKKVDFLIHLSGTVIKRQGDRRERGLLDELDRIRKKHWIVQELDKARGMQWTFLQGLNWSDLREMRKQGFHYIHSDKGQDIIKRLHYTVDELKDMDQPELPYTTYDEY